MATDGPDALVMCGGRGSRLRDSADGAEVTEKPLFPVAGRPMVERVLAALAGARPVGTVHAAVSPHAPDTREHLRERAAGERFRVVETPGEGYVADLAAALDDPRVTRPVVTAVADLPLLAPDAVETALTRSGDGACDLAVCVPVALKEALGVSVDRRRDPGDPSEPDVIGPAAGRALAPTGLNVVARADGENERERVYAGWDARLAVNVNYAADATVADRLAADAETEGEGRRKDRTGEMERNRETEREGGDAGGSR